MVQQDDLETVRRVYAAFDRADLGAVVALVEPEVTVVQSPALPWGGTHHGVEGVGRFLHALSTCLDSRAETELLLHDGAGHVVQVGRTRGAVRASGAAFDVREVHVWTVRQGRVQRFEAYVDHAAMSEALTRTGTAPAAPPTGAA